MVVLHDISSYQFDKAAPIQMLSMVEKAEDPSWLVVQLGIQSKVQSHVVLVTNDGEPGQSVLMGKEKKKEKDV
nr:hypothetical protein [Tanacetum cinerariifolium]